MFISIVEAKLGSVNAITEVRLVQEMDAEPEHYEVQHVHPTGVIQIKHSVSNIVDALALFNQLIKDLVMTGVDKNQDK